VLGKEPMYLVRLCFTASGGQAGLQGVAVIYDLACVWNCHHNTWSSLGVGCHHNIRLGQDAGITIVYGPARVCNLTIIYSPAWVWVSP